METVGARVVTNITALLKPLHHRSLTVLLLLPQRLIHFVVTIYASSCLKRRKEEEKGRKEKSGRAPEAATTASSSTGRGFLSSLARYSLVTDTTPTATAYHSVPAHSAHNVSYVLAELCALICKKISAK